jgi:hypothetical protein
MDWVLRLKNFKSDNKKVWTANAWGVNPNPSACKVNWNPRGYAPYKPTVPLTRQQYGRLAKAYFSLFDHT